MKRSIGVNDMSAKAVDALEAAENVARYLSELRRNKTLDHENIHSLHLGTERSAQLRTSDLEILLESLPAHVHNSFFRKHRRHFVGDSE